MQHDPSFKFRPAPTRRLSACRQTRRQRLLRQLRTPDPSLSPGLSRKPAAGRLTRVGRTRLIHRPQAAGNCRWSAILRRLRQRRLRRRARRQPAWRSTLNPVRSTLRPTVRPRHWRPRRNRRESLRLVAVPRRWRGHRDPASIGLPMRRPTAQLPRQMQHQYRQIQRPSLPRRPRLRQSRPRPPPQ
jgi:hypothetical protein